MRILIVSLFLSALLLTPGAKAETTFGDAALVVGLTTVAGSIIGASTLPFYEDSGAHTENILYGAAVGAVTGVLISAYAGVREVPDYEDASNPRLAPSKLSLNEAPAMKLKAEASASIRKPASFAGGAPAMWSSLASIRF